LLGGPEDDDPNPGNEIYRRRKDHGSALDHSIITFKSLRNHIRRYKPSVLMSLALEPLAASFFDLLTQLLSWNPKKRVSASTARNHRFLTQARELGWLDRDK
jgi:serine/threonine protein kinase